MYIPNKYKRDTTKAIELPFDWDELKKLSFVFKSGKEVDVVALSKPVYEAQTSSSGSTVFLPETKILYKNDVIHYIDFPLWWYISYVGHAQSIIRAMHLYRYMMREEFKEVYAENIDGGFYEAKFDKHYMKYISEENDQYMIESRQGATTGRFLRKL